MFLRKKGGIISLILEGGFDLMTSSLTEIGRLDGECGIRTHGRRDLERCSASVFRVQRLKPLSQLSV